MFGIFAWRLAYPPAASAAAENIMLLGDSYPAFTFVVSLTDNPGAMPANQQRHKGHSGFTVGGIVAGLDSRIVGANPDTILLHIGTNNFGGDVSSTDATNVASAHAVETQLDSLVIQFSRMRLPFCICC